MKIKIKQTMIHSNSKKLKKIKKVNHFSEDPKILRLADWKGWTVAHIQATKGWKTEDLEILRLADWKGWTWAVSMMVSSILITIKILI